MGKIAHWKWHLFTICELNENYTKTKNQFQSKYPEWKFSHCVQRLPKKLINENRVCIVQIERWKLLKATQNSSDTVLNDCGKHLTFRTENLNSYQHTHTLPHEHRTWFSELNPDERQTSEGAWRKCRSKRQNHHNTLLLLRVRRIMMKTMINHQQRPQHPRQRPHRRPPL